MAVRLRTASQGRDESVFVAAADFFSLLSISTIYALVVLRSGAPGGASVDTAKVVEAANVTAQELVTNVLYVALEAQGSALNVKVILPPGTYADVRRFDFADGEVDNAANWTFDTITTAGTPFEKVICYLPPNERRPVAHKFLNEIVRKLEERYAVQVVL